jgi:5-methylthioadenosine/S-adenosylhomocysteine deaminase
MSTTVIKNADWVIAWDESAGRHVYRRGADVAFADDMIIFVGPNYPGAAERAALPRRAGRARGAQYAHDRAL